MLRNYTATNEVNQTRHFIVSTIILLALSRYTVHPKRQSSSGETNT